MEIFPAVLIVLAILTLCVANFAPFKDTVLASLSFQNLTYILHELFQMQQAE